MNIKAIVASLVLGSSSVALAAPSVTVSATLHGEYGTTAVRTHRHVSPPIMRPSPPVVQPIRWTLPPVYRPVMLANELSFSGTASDRRFITVGAQAGRFDQIQIRGSEGRTFIKQVYVQFDNGQEQVVRNLDRTLSRREALTLDLDGSHRAIRRIVVYGHNIDNGFRHEDSAFHVTAL